MSWSKSDKKDNKNVVESSESFKSQRSQSVSVHTFERRSVYELSTTSTNGNYVSSIPSSSHTHLNYLSPLRTPSISNSTTGTTLPNTVLTDANSIRVNPRINLRYQSPYSYNRNSPQYSSLQPITHNQNTGTAFRPALPATEQPMPEEPPKRIVVKKTGKLYDGPGNSVPTYSTHSKKRRGDVFIINNIMFKDNRGYRYGAEVDDMKLEDLFKQMGFTVTVKRDLKKHKMLSEMKSFSKKTSLRSADIVVVVVMSHGTTNQSLGGTEIFSSDEKGILVDELMDYFNEEQCKAMKDKPKIFIFQCCRGDNEHFVRKDSERVPANIKPLTNALIAYSSLPGFVSHRDPKHGTWYISTLCDVFSKNAHEYHVEDLLKIVDVQLGSFNKDVKQTTHYECRGFKRCFLHPI